MITIKSNQTWQIPSRSKYCCFLKRWSVSPPGNSAAATVDVKEDCERRRKRGEERKLHEREGEKRVIEERRKENCGRREKRGKGKEGEEEMDENKVGNEWIDEAEEGREAMN